MYMSVILKVISSLDPLLQETFETQVKFSRERPRWRKGFRVA